MKNFFIVVLILGLNFSGFSQSAKRFEIGGIIYSEIDKKVLSDATVWIEPSQGYGVSSDSTGSFIFSSLTAGPYRIQVGKFAYEKIDTLVHVSDSSIPDLQFWLNANCNFNKKSAIEDIQKKKPMLLLVGGSVPIVYESQKKFERNFNVKYHDFGCLPEATECIIEYNKMVFKHLDKKYGQLWRKSVRSDVIGLSKFP